MQNQELFKQAILDAKAVRETAMAAARTTLAEHFEPYIKETMEKTLTQEEDYMETEAPMNEEPNMDEATLDEILAELDALSEEDGDSDLEEGKTGYDEKAKTSKGETGYDKKAGKSHGDHKLHEAEDDEAEDKNESEAEDNEAGEEGDMMGGEQPESTDEQEVVDITVGELKDIIRDVFMQLQGGGEMAPEAPLDADTDLAADLGGEEMGGEEEEDAISLDEILADLEKEEEKVHEVAGAGEIPGGKIVSKADQVNDVVELKKNLNEAVKTIKALKTELNEINLFSAKLLYVNKLFKAKNLSEAQKTKVVNAFDRATSVKEVENTYKTLLESLGTVGKKSTIKESIGFASKPIGNAPARPIVEADAFVSRWQHLAGIK